MANILVPIHADQDAQWIIRYLLKLHQRERIRVHLLNVQPRYTGHVGLFFSRQMLAAFQQEDAERSLASMRKLLDAAGIPYNAHFTIGSAVDEIAKFAKNCHCPQIVIGPTQENWFKELFFSSLSHRVDALMRHADPRCEVL